MTIALLRSVPPLHRTMVIISQQAMVSGVQPQPYDLSVGSSRIPREFIPLVNVSSG